MNFADPHQANGLPVDPFSIPYQPHHDAQQNAWVSFQHRNILLLQMLIHHCLPPQVPWLPPAANGRAEGHREDIPPPGGMQDPHHFDVAYQGVVDHNPQPLRVSYSRLSSTEPPFDQRLGHPGNRTLYMYSPMQDPPSLKVSRHKHSPTRQWVPVYVS